jgi:hypothetical protein
VQGKSAWHLAADLVEQYSPLLWGVVNADITERELEQRRVNDEALAKDAGALLTQPVVYVLDELPVEFKRRKGETARFQQSSWSLLVVVELLWHEDDSDPFSLPQREAWAVSRNSDSLSVESFG